MNFSGSAALTVFLFLVAAYGWGRVGGFFCDARILRYQSLSIVLGLALLNVVGGFLNWLGLARAMTLLALLLGGAVLAAVHLLKSRPWQTWPLAWKRLRAGGGSGFLSLLPFLLALLGSAVACWLLAATTVFNFHDDLHTYITRTVRMVQTGSLAGNPFESIGLDSQGSQSFFQGFFVHGSEVNWLNAFDAVACFAVCLWFVAELAARWRLPWFIGTLGVIGLIVLDPQPVNISPLYSGMLFVMALIVCGSFLARALAAPRARQGYRLEVTLALLSATLVTLKTTLAFFAAIYLCLFYAVLLVNGPARRMVLKSAMVTGLLVVLFVLPWACAYRPVLQEAKRFGQPLQKEAALVPKHPSLVSRDIRGLFSASGAAYTDTPAAFHLIAGMCAVLGLTGLGLWWCRRDPQQKSGLPSIAAAGVAVPVVYLLNAHLFIAGTAIRYSCPILIGAFVSVCLNFLRFGRSPGRVGRNWSGWLAAGLLVIAIGAFLLSFKARFSRALSYRCSLAFRIDRNYCSYSTSMVSADERSYYQALQALIPADTTVLVWTVAPFHMDFTRNRVFTASEPGLINPAVHFPAGAPLPALQSYLRQWGVRYVLLELRGLAVRDLDNLKSLLTHRDPVYRKLGDYGYYFRSSLLDLAERNRVIHRDSRMLLFEFTENPQGNSRPTAPGE